jgi:hypothetical protein
MLAKALGVSVRTFERWCAKGDVPGVYRTRGGHLRVRTPSKALISKLMETPDYGETRKGRIAKLFLFLSPPEPPSETKRKLERFPEFLYGMTHGEEFRRAFDVAKAAHGFSNDARENVKLARDDSEKRKLWHRTPIGEFIQPDHWRAAERPTAVLMTTAAMLRVSQNNMTSATLARALGIARRTLYNRYGRDAVKTACSLGSPGRVVLPSRCAPAKSGLGNAHLYHVARTFRAD